MLGGQQPLCDLGVGSQGKGMLPSPSPARSLFFSQLRPHGVNRGLYFPPPSSVTSVNGFLITHINQHD